MIQPSTSKTFFYTDHRPEMIKIGDDMQCPAPASWVLGEWDEDGWADVEFDGFVQAIHATKKEYGGCRLHFLITSHPSKPDICFFEENREGGMQCRFTPPPSDVHIRQVHVFENEDDQDGENLQIMLRAAQESGTHVKIKGRAWKIVMLNIDGTVADEEIQKEAWSGWGSDNKCPIIHIHTLHQVR